jgi:hypothetical protein
MNARYYTIAEANALLPDLRVVVANLLAARQRIVDLQPELWPMLEKAVGNGGSKKAGQVLADFEKIQAAVRTIEGWGLQLKDINTGLIDFLSKRDGREVYLCWRYDEPRVAHWHDLDAGFAGRQPL